MKALVLEKDGVLAYKEVELPRRPSPDAVLIRVRASGICSSDLARGFGGKAYHYPLIMGHEFCGRVQECAEEPAVEAEPFDRGDLVAVFPLIPCGKCAACQTGDLAQCENYDYLGSRRDGAFAEYVWVPDRNLFAVPESVSALHAAMTEPCAVALHAVSRMAIEAGATAAVIGAGPIGNMAAQWLRALGCGRVIVTDIDGGKREIAEKMGFEAVDAGSGNPVAAIYDRTGGRGADCVIEACGLPQTFLQAVQATGRFGQVVFMGNIRGTFSIDEKDFSNILRKELVIRGTWNSRVVPRHRNDWTVVLESLGGRIDVGPLISDTPALEQGPEIFGRMLRREESFGKVIFELGDEG
jgi:L-iditol 2-dehydrogenase/galactitol-1-phosphate 5-dehydrogenase